ncbi:MAG TPA: hypothetical protein VK184_22345 [Nostocaceae cyanobacterium]|nr:hypothetical protein [Nostocaceae cyanobacterium]
MEASNFITPTDNTLRETLKITIKSQKMSRREFMKLPLAERRKILAQQAELMLQHYAKNQEWQELETGDFIDY